MPNVKPVTYDASVKYRIEEWWLTDAEKLREPGETKAALYRRLFMVGVLNGGRICE